MSFLVIGAVAISLIALYFIAFRRKQTVKLTADEYNLLMRRKFDNYDLRSFLVRGDFNTTFEAFDHDRKTTVALRILDHTKIYHDQIVQQFNLKAEMLKFLAERYPGDRFVQGIKFGTVKIEEEPRPYIVSDYVQGVGLHDILDRYGRLAPKDTLQIIRQLGESVSLAHAPRIWVREIAPQNVLLTLNPARKLVVTLANVGVPFKSLPSEFSAEAKKGYYSPEDRKDELVDERSDVYALAALTFRMLQGYDPSVREAGEPYNDLTIPLERLLTTSLLSSPGQCGDVSQTLTVLQSAKSTARLIPWDREIPGVIAKRVKMKIKTHGRGSHRAADAVPRSLSNQTATGLSFRLSRLPSSPSSWIGRRLKVCLPARKIYSGLGIVLVGGFIALWYFVYFRTWIL
jgi:serine/threonine protein kinase